MKGTANVTEQTETGAIDPYDTTATLEGEGQRLDVINDDVLALVNMSPAELMAKAAEKGIDPHSDEIDQIATLQATNKNKLIDVDFMMVDWMFYEGKHVNPETGERNEFVRIVFVTADGRKGLIIDSSKVGICAQVKLMTERREAAGIYPYGFKRVRGGLRVSRYTNQHGEAETFYLNVKDESMF